jgi:hypothetical protein
MSWIAVNRQFEPENLYLQWLRRRRAWPMRIDYRLMPYFWIVSGILSVLLVATTDSHLYFGLEVFLAIGVTVVALILPVINTVLDFVYYMPRSVHDDESSSMMQFLFMAPVESVAILNDVRKWAVLINLKHLAPSALLVFTGILVITHDTNFSSPDFFDVMKVMMPMVLFVILLWAFFLGTGLVAAGLPWKATSTGAIVLCWVAPVMAVVLWGGSYVADLDKISNYPEPDWFFWHYILLLLIPTWITHRIAPWLMERRRSDNY